MYFDNAATSWPKPKGVVTSIISFMYEEASSPLRTEGNDSDSIVYQTRQLITELINEDYPSRVIFTQNATEALNLSIYGILEDGDHVITTVTEHNSVIRPLKDLEAKGNITIDWVKCDEYGLIDPGDIRKQIKENTKLIVVNHVSNVLGTIQPVSEIGRIAKENNIIFLLDASQSIGHIDIDNKEIQADLIAFPGHKGLYGPPGTGVLYINQKITLKPLKRGTGVLSELLEQPDGLPTKYESGSLNTLGIFGLNAALKYIKEEKINDTAKSLETKTSYLRERLSGIPGMKLYGKDSKIGIVSFNIGGYHPGRIGSLLNQKYGIKVRTGLHCAPLIHKYIGTLPFGTVRASIGEFTSESEIKFFVFALNELMNNLPRNNIKMPADQFKYDDIGAMI